MSYINRSDLFQRLFCFKSSVPLLYSPEQHRQRCPLHPWTFPSRECMGVLSVPKNQKRVGQWRWWSIDHIPIQKLLRGHWWRDRGRLTWLAGFMAKRVKWPNNERSEALGTRLQHHRSYGATAFTGRQPVGQWLSPTLSLCWSHGLPSSYGLGHPLNHHTEAGGTCFALR